MPQASKSACLLSFSSVLLLAVLCVAAFGQNSSMQQGGIHTHVKYSVSGYVTKGADSVANVDGARVELRSPTGATISVATTSGNGNFSFPSVDGGEYYLFVSFPGYDDLTQMIEVDEGPLTQVRLEIHRTSGATDTASGPPTVSTRELSIPHKAHDAFEKGMALLYGKKDYKSSVGEFQKAVQGFPTYYEAYAQIGIARMRMNDREGSEQALRKAIEVSSEMYADAYSYLALLFSTNQRYTDAEPLARKAVELDGNSWMAHAELVRSLFGENRFEEAETVGLQAVTLQPNEPSLRLMLADIHVRLHNYTEVLKDLDAYLKLAPDGPEAPHARETRDKILAALANEPGGTAQTPSTQPHSDP